MAKTTTPSSSSRPPQQTQALARQSAPTVITEIIKSKEKSIRSMLPSQINAPRFMRTMIEVLTNPKLLECTPASIEKSIMDLAYLGLEVGPLGYAFLIPFAGVCQLQIGYKGLVALAKRSGAVSNVQADVVREGDLFEYAKGTDSFLKHVPAFDDGREKKKILYTWAMFTLKDGTNQWDIMDRMQVLAIRDRSQGYQAAKKYGKPSPWDTDEAEMFKKTVLKRVCKLMDLSPELAKALEVDNEADGVVKATVDVPAPVVEEPKLGRKAPVPAQDAEVSAPEPVVKQEPVVDEMTGEIFDPEGSGFNGEDAY